MKILITGAGGPAAISVWKSLNTAHELVMADMDPHASGLYLVKKENRILLPAGAAPDFVDKLLIACRTHRVELLCSTVDAELVAIAARRGEFEQIGVKVPTASKEILEICRSKTDLLNAVEKLDVPIPSSVRWTQTASWNRFPAFAKPDAGSGSRGLHTIECAADLEKIPRDGDYIVQELLPQDEYSVDVFAVPTGSGVRAIAAVIRQRMKTDSGIAITARTVHDPLLQALAIKVVEGLRIPYVSNVQFKKNARGEPRFLEVNPRFPGTLPLTTLAGIDMPHLLVKCFSAQTMPSELLPYEEKMIVRYMIEHQIDPEEFEQLSVSCAK